MGARPIWTDPETHDWAVGIVSHLPQLVSVALARVVQDETDETGLPLSLSGPGLQDMLRLAGSPYEIWRDILLTNTDNASRALDRLAQAVDYLRTNLAQQGTSAGISGRQRPLQAAAQALLIDISRETRPTSEQGRCSEFF